MSGELTTTGGFAIEGMQGAMNLAKAMASAKMVPQHLQGSPGDCLMVIEQAMRWQMSPFAVAQATAVVRGKMCFEGKLVAAAIQTSGILEGRLRYDFEGTADKRKVICSGHIRGEAKERSVEVTLESAKTNNEWWTKTPDQMLTYHAARVWARRHAPEVMLGVYSPDEFDTARNEQEVIDVTPQSQRIEQPRQIDHRALMAERLTKCSDVLTVDTQWRNWDAAIANAEKAGKIIPEDVQSDVRDMIAARRAELEQKAAEAPVDEVVA
ncbi:recombinase RecT [Acetobacter indonesiensis]|uniref:recombinase RecT n=1 Tax=Acetobacter indonesiensis TaxID=104101 RepID=UPI000A37A905|nr:recombinase RecT [Acetobacter indonesiensis]